MKEVEDVMKIKEYLKSKNPYLLASAAIVIVSVGIIIALQQEKPAEGSVQDVISVVVESEGMDDVETEKEEKEESAIETLETAGEEAETESDSESSSEPGQYSETEESYEPVKEPDGEVEPEETSESTEEMTPEESPEKVPAGESQEPPETDSEEVVVPEPEETPEPSEIPEPDVHEHSWIFESFYQEPTCSNGGLVTQICAKCGETQITGGIPTGEHSYEVETEGDCCSETVVVCTECNFREVREKDPDNHIDVEDGFCYGCGKKTE